MPKSPEGMPSPEEVKKAEGMMTPEEGRSSKDRVAELIKKKEEESKENKDFELIRDSGLLDSRGHLIEFGEGGNFTEYISAREGKGQYKGNATKRLTTSRGFEEFEK